MGLLREEASAAPHQELDRLIPSQSRLRARVRRMPRERPRHGAGQGSRGRAE
jgi:hypothetical protein